MAEVRTLIRARQSEKRAQDEAAGKTTAELTREDETTQSRPHAAVRLSPYGSIQLRKQAPWNGGRSTLENKSSRARPLHPLRSPHGTRPPGCRTTTSWRRQSDILGLSYVVVVRDLSVSRQVRAECRSAWAHRPGATVESHAFDRASKDSRVPKKPRLHCRRPHWRHSRSWRRPHLTMR